jgi:hypothetical protein
MSSVHFQKMEDTCLTADRFPLHSEVSVLRPISRRGSAAGGASDSKPNIQKPSELAVPKAFVFLALERHQLHLNPFLFR